MNNECNHSDTTTILGILKDRLLGKALAIDGIENRSPVRDIVQHEMNYIRIVHEDGFSDYLLADSTTQITILDCLMKDAPKLGCDCRMCESARYAKM
jgi:hypothetical protein